MLEKCCYPEPEPGAGTGAGSKLDRLHNTGSMFLFNERWRAKSDSLLKTICPHPYVPVPAVLWSRSLSRRLSRPEPDFFAGDEAG